MKLNFSRQPASSPMANSKAVRAVARRKRKTGASKQPARPPVWVWLATGIAVGLLVTFLYQLINNSPEAKLAGKAAANSSKAIANTATSNAVAEPEEFTFFDRLLGNEVGVEDHPSTTPASIKGPPEKVYFLQAGSFPTVEQADSQRAQIAFLGEETQLETVSVNNQTLYRVMLGPIYTHALQQSISSKLLAEGIETLPSERAKP